jgi:hypothetical protein
MVRWSRANSAPWLGDRNVLTSLLLLALTASPEPSSASPGEEPGAVTATPPSVKLGPEVLAKLDVRPEWQGSRAQKVLPYALGEGLILIMSALAADGPQGTGWALVGLSPLAYMNMQPGGTIGFTTIGAAGVAAIGLYNALELRGRRYSRGQRFWINMAAWHAWAATLEVAGAIIKEQRASEIPTVALGMGAGGPMLTVVGRF